MSDRSSSFLSGGGDAGALVRSLDWSKTALGPPSGWSASLKAAIGIVLHSRHPMFLWWGPDLVQFYNDAYSPSFGVGKHPAAMGQRGEDCWQEIWPIIWPQIDDVMARGISSWNEDALVPIYRNGRIEEVYWTYGYSPVIDDDGSIGGTIVVCTETTSRVLVDRRLGTLRVIAERTMGSIDAEGVLESVFGALASAKHDVPFALTYARAHDGEAPRVGRSVHLVDPDRAARAIASARANGASARELRLVDFEPGAVESTANPWPEAPTQAVTIPLRTPHGETSLVFGVSARLTFDAAYEAFLRQMVEIVDAAVERSEVLRIRTRMEAERRNLLLQAPVATSLLIGPRHRFELANPLYVKMVGGRDVVGKDYLVAFPEVAGTELAEVVDRVYRTGVPFVAEEYYVPLAREPGGPLEPHYFRFNLEPVRDDTGVVYGMMCIAMDMTEQANARLALEKTTEERERLLVRLEAANRAKDDFLAMLGHELRNPLAPIVTAVQVMKLKPAEASRREADIIERQAAHLSRLLDDLLDVSRVARGKVDLKKERVAMADIVDNAMEIASPLFEKKAHRLHLEVPREGLDIDADPARMAQILSNVLTNAAKYTAEGGRVSVVATREEDVVVVRVEDNGGGISPEELPHLFEAFFQATRSGRRPEGGLGLGLALVKSFVELHGGTVAVRSEGIGRGTELVIRVPAASDDVTGPKSRASASLRAAPVVEPQRVLLVDDNEDLAELLAELLRRHGHVVEVAHDGPSALHLVTSFVPDVAVLDIGLPVMDGYALAEQLRVRLSDHPPRLVAVSGYGQAVDRERTRRAGFQAHLVKPVDTASLLAVLKRPPSVPPTE